MEKVIIFDTTLRDGEQSSGAALNNDEKLEIARQLEKLKVDVIEAGFPIASPGDLEAVRRISQEVRGPIICALAHAQPKAVDAAWEAVKLARSPRIHVFLSSSEVHISHQLKKSKSQVLTLSRDMVARAKGYLEDVEFSSMGENSTSSRYPLARATMSLESFKTWLLLFLSWCEI